MEKCLTLNMTLVKIFCLNKSLLYTHLTVRADLDFVKGNKSTEIKNRQHKKTAHTHTHTIQNAI